MKRLGLLFAALLLFSSHSASAEEWVPTPNNCNKVAIFVGDDLGAERGYLNVVPGGFFGSPEPCAYRMDVTDPQDPNLADTLYHFHSYFTDWEQKQAFSYSRDGYVIEVSVMDISWLSGPVDTWYAIDRDPVTGQEISRCLTLGPGDMRFWALVAVTLPSGRLEGTLSGSASSSLQYVSGAGSSGSLQLTFNRDESDPALIALLGGSVEIPADYGWSLIWDSQVLDRLLGQLH